MKKLSLLTIILTLCFYICIMGQVNAQTPNVLKGYGFVGARYTHAVVGKDAALGSIGFMTRVSGALYTAAYLDVGQYGSIKNDWILLTPVQQGSNVYVGFIAGPNADFKAVGDSGQVISYLTGAGGAMFAWQSKSKILGFNNPGLWAVARYSFKFDNAVTYVNGWTAGLGVFLPF